MVNGLKGDQNKDQVYLSIFKGSSLKKNGLNWSLALWLRNNTNMSNFSRIKFKKIINIKTQDENKSIKFIVFKYYADQEKIKYL